MSDVKPFVAQLIRLVLIIVAILACRQVIVMLPMVGPLDRLPGINISAYELVTAIAYLSILVLLVSFANNVEAIMIEQPGRFPWQSLVAQVFILAGVIFAYGALDVFANALLGRHLWTYHVALLLLAVVPVVGIGKLLYTYLSECLERWEG